MKMVSGGKVYDLSYDGYESVCRLPAGVGVNEVGTGVPVQKELRRDNASKRFYVYEGSSDYDYDRRRVAVREISAGNAAALAEPRVTYETYVKFFGDPELAEAENAAAAKDRRIAELESELARLKETTPCLP